MGSDYFTTYVDMGNDAESFIDSLRNFISSASDDLIDRMCADIFYDENEGGRQSLLEIVKEFETIIEDANDVSIIEINGSEVIVTGGFSWGDDPTDSYNCICNTNIISHFMRFVR